MNTPSANPRKGHDVAPYTVHEAYIEDHRFDGLRSGEGSVARLADDSLFMVYGQFKGPGDEDKAVLLARRSHDGGRSWSTPVTVKESPADALNVMSVSLLMLADGRLAMVYLVKQSMMLCYPLFQTSSDGGQSWSSPVRAMARDAYHCVNNDRMIQLSTGRLLIPFHHYPVGPGKGRCGCVYSDDVGKTWKYSSETWLTPQTFRRARHIDTTQPDVVKVMNEGDVHVREPGVIELGDGRVMMWARSTGGYAYRCYSQDAGETWGPFEAISEFAMPNGPQSLMRLPGGSRIMMLYNDRGDLPVGHHQFQWRRPLSVAVSDDEARTWKYHGLLEPETTPSNCYYSICFQAGNVLMTYYEGVMHVDRQGVYSPRNLASLKLKVMSQKWFEL